ncbi:MAG: hypothetical protein J3K34DRAFT_477443 [Monoraphidium minutum]|nr:MAG: hypothetical protein J3K34DRAFT_477443 [Monoraphidium minutum]
MSAGTWMTGAGVRYGPDFSLALRMRTDAEYKIVPTPDGRGTREVHPAGPGADGAYSFRALLASLEINGKDVMPQLESGEVLTFAGGAVRVHLPATKHKGDPTDGLLLMLHLDFKLVTRSTAVRDMHGVLGQTWAWARGAPAAIEGDELDYALRDGLLGTDFKYSCFEAAGETHGAPTRRLLAGAPVAVGVECGSARALLAASP